MAANSFLSSFRKASPQIRSALVNVFVGVGVAATGWTAWNFAHTGIGLHSSAQQGGWSKSFSAYLASTRPFDPDGEKLKVDMAKFIAKTGPSVHVITAAEGKVCV